MALSEQDKIMCDIIGRYTEEVAKWKADIKIERISYLASKKITHLVDQYDGFSNKVELLDNLLQTLQLLSSIQVQPDIEELQEFVYRMLNSNLLSSNEKHKAFDLAKLIGLDIQNDK